MATTAPQVDGGTTPKSGVPPVVDPYAATGIPPVPPPAPAATPPAVPAATPPALSGLPPGLPSGLTPVGTVGSTTASPAPATATPAATPPPTATPPVAQNTPTGVGVQDFGPGNTLIGQQITSQGQPDRMQIAKDYFSQMSEAGAPAYEAALRSATQREAANGGLGSGQLNTTYGNLALQRGRDLNLLERGLTTDATQATIGDQAVNRNEYRTERDYQNALQTQALQQRLQQLMLEQQIGQGQAGYLSGYNPNPNIVASNAAGNQAASSSAALQALLQASYGQMPATAQPPYVLPGGTNVGTYGTQPWNPNTGSTTIGG